MHRCRELPSTAAVGHTSRGTGTRLIRLALSTTEVVPALHARLKKVKGIRPHSTKTGNLGTAVVGKAG
jgi:hypothetical protein